VSDDLQHDVDAAVARIGVLEAEKWLAIDAWSIRGRNALVRAIDRAKEADDRREQLDLTLGDRRTLQGEIDAGKVFLQVYACPDCGQRISDQTVKNRSWPPRCFECNRVDPEVQTLMDGKPMISVEIPVRKLPDAFRHVDTPSRTTLSERYIRKLVRSIDQQRQAAVPVRDVAFPHNARVLLRFAAARAGVTFEQGRVAVLGDGQDARVHFYVDPEDGLGAAANLPEPYAPPVGP
jgi:hypothetical protein